VVISGFANNALFRYKASGAGNTLQLSAAVLPQDATDRSLGWQSSNSLIASVDANGLVKFSGTEGAVDITASAAGGSGASASLTIRVAKNVTGIRTPLKAYYIQKGKSLTLPLALDDSSKKDLTKPLATALEFSSSNPKVLTVDKKTGRVKAAKKVKRAVKVTVTVTAPSGVKKKIPVYVVPKATKLQKVKVSGYKTKMKVGALGQLKVSATPAKATGLAVTFKSSKASGLYVDKAGKLVALKKGKYTVTVRMGGKKVKTKKITVK
jgi:uncharacterized protein YjdB